MSSDAAPQQPARFSANTAPSEAAATADSGGQLVPSTAPAKPPVRRIVHNQVPRELLEDKELAAAMSMLPKNYNFEVHKSIWRLRNAKCKLLALQFPEGLLLYACALADIFKAFAGVEDCIVMGDVAYGACCVDDFSARALGADFLIHYGHSCLVPVDVTAMPCMYVFVDIAFETGHLVECIQHNFRADENIAIAGTIQFTTTVAQVKAKLAAAYPHMAVPQVKPLSGGEVLGCTAPTLPADTDALVFVADGRFHLESIMIQNPHVPAYRYDPYSRVLTREEYDQAGMRAVRRKAIEAARKASRFGIILGTLGRQGNPAILAHLEQLFTSRRLRYSVVLLSEISPAKLNAMSDVEAWVQIACPRLSIDWGEGFRIPVLTPYEAEVAFGEAPAFWNDADDAAPSTSRGAVATTGGSDGALGAAEGAGAGGRKIGAYPMDFYSRESGPWGNGFHNVRRGAAAAGGAGPPPAAAGVPPPAATVQQPVVVAPVGGGGGGR